ncbi:MAG: uroporphyrinogen decarboxylase family protein [Bacillota bacterium]
MRFDVASWGGHGPHWERVRAVLGHESPDRPPITAWRHFPSFENSAEGLARVHLAFQMRFDYDLLMFTPPFAYTAVPWGYEPGTDFDEYGRPTHPERPFAALQQWPVLSTAGVQEGIFDEMLESLRLTVRNLPSEVPVLLTAYGPLTTAYFLRGEAIASDLGREGVLDGDFREALRTIDSSLRDFYSAGLEIADGLYLISYFAASDILGDRELTTDMMRLDLSPLHHFSAADRLLALHLHGNDILFDEVLDQPLDVLNWHDRWVKPSLRDARIKSDLVLMGGMNEADTIHRETPSAVSLQVEDAVSQVEGRGLIVAPGGPIKVSTPVENLRAVVAAVDALS